MKISRINQSRIKCFVYPKPNFAGRNISLVIMRFLIRLLNPSLFFFHLYSLASPFNHKKKIFFKKKKKRKKDW